jgi:hypothetical protein
LNASVSLTLERNAHDGHRIALIPRDQRPKLIRLRRIVQDMDRAIAGQEQ